MDFRLKTFVSVARHRSFTRAARELFITQPAVTRHIKELEAQAGTTLFDRSGGGIALTKAGEAMLFHAEKILDSYRRMQFDMNLLTGNFSGELRLGASSTIAQYVLPPCLARFSTRYPEIRLTLDTGNSRQMVQALFSRSIDLALVEGEARHAGIRYEPFMRDELVLVTGSRSAYAARETVTPQELTALPIVLRENGSGTLEVIERRLGERQIKLSSLNVIMQMGSTEGIKSFLASYDCVALLSVQAVTRELLSDTLTVIDIDGLSFEREFAFATLQGVPGTVAGDFMRFASETLPHTRKNNRKSKPSSRYSPQPSWNRSLCATVSATRSPGAICRGTSAAWVQERRPRRPSVSFAICGPVSSSRPESPGPCPANASPWATPC